MPDFSRQSLSFSKPPPFFFRARGKMLDLSRPALMGILNLSADSFFAGSRVEAIDKLISAGGKMLEEGASILDVGALSSRPGSRLISEKEEIMLLAPGINALRQKFPDAVISADVFRPEVAAAALDAGADIINNIQGLQATDQLLASISSFRAGYILMHSRGAFSEMHHANNYQQIATEVASELAIAIGRARQAGITDIVADPGFGFSKNPEQNFALFRDLYFLKDMLDCPLLVGISRKSMIYRTMGGGPEDALNGTTALHMAALIQGAHILRVHDVRPAKECILLFEKLCSPEL